ncbi:hypothetical protein BSR29_05905 [Boudabousia liubingyangii]|uniref:Uncharacterized protein n=1 Tax=Boudabousia liubingyangii TaxID=1921764 RepID=A0A1Q5PLU3_9ACTO|nr:hypothetical protein [Boudabousia liubingyangii]OKL48010.1 hypothetical protein BSR29_05905 [Boudabousia liubingyangii]
MKIRRLYKDPGFLVMLTFFVLVVGMFGFATHYANEQVAASRRAAEEVFSTSTDPVRKELLSQEALDLPESELEQTFNNVNELVSKGDFKTLQEQYLLEPEKAQLLANDPNTVKYFEPLNFDKDLSKFDPAHPGELQIYNYSGKYAGIPAFTQKAYFTTANDPAPQLSLEYVFVGTPQGWKVLDIKGFNNLALKLPYRVPTSLTMSVKSGEQSFDLPVGKDPEISLLRTIRKTYWALPNTYQLALAAQNGLIYVPETQKFNWSKLGQEFTWEPEMSYKATEQLENQLEELLTDQIKKELAEDKIPGVISTKNTLIPDSLTITEANWRYDSWDFEGNFRISGDLGESKVSFRKLYVVIGDNGKLSELPNNIKKVIPTDNR